MYQSSLRKARPSLFLAKVEHQSPRFIGPFMKGTEESSKQADSGLAPEYAKVLTENNVELRLQAISRK